MIWHVIARFSSAPLFKMGGSLMEGITQQKSIETEG
jgi:hypothetical protein